MSQSFRGHYAEFLQAGHSLTRSLSLMPRTMPDPEFVKMNKLQITDLKLRSWSPERSRDLPKITGFLVNGAGVTTLRSPDPQATLYYISKEGVGGVYLILSFPYIWRALLALTDLKECLAPSSKKQVNCRVAAPLWALDFCPWFLRIPCLKLIKTEVFQIAAICKHHYAENIKQQGQTDLFSLHKSQFNFGNLLLETSQVWDPGTGLRIQRRRCEGQMGLEELNKARADDKKTAATTASYRITRTTTTTKKTSDFYNLRWLPEFSCWKNSSCASWKTALLIPSLSFFFSSFVNDPNRAQVCSQA